MIPSGDQKAREIVRARSSAKLVFAATLALLFSKRRVNPVKLTGEAADDARKRVMQLIEDESGYVLLLQMLHRERAGAFDLTGDRGMSSHGRAEFIKDRTLHADHDPTGPGI